MEVSCSCNTASCRLQFGCNGTVQRFTKLYYKQCRVEEENFYICNAEDTHKGPGDFYLSGTRRDTYWRHTDSDRDRHHETIRLLRDFDDKMFLAAHDAKFLLEDARLEDLDQKTLLWYEENVLGKM